MALFQEISVQTLQANNHTHSSVPALQLELQCQTHPDGWKGDTGGTEKPH